MYKYELNSFELFRLPVIEKSPTTYRTRAIISSSLYFFDPIFPLAAAYIADNLCTKNGNSSFFKLKIRGL
jgi:hypothetical protein